MFFMKWRFKTNFKVVRYNGLYIVFSLIFLIFAYMQSFEYSRYFRDYANYIIYFKDADIEHLYSNVSKSGWSYFLLSIFSEEFGWRIYTIVCSFFLKPESCIPFTVFFINALIVVSLKKLNRPFLSLFLWIILPVGFSMTGLLQIRQGLAFSIFMFVFLCYSRPIIASILAATIHTTFVIPLIFLIINWFFKKKPFIVVAMILVSVSLTMLIGSHFGLIAGRRAHVYALDETGTGLYCIFESFFAVLPSIIWLITSKNWNKIAVMHVGLFIWLCACLVFFPLGMFRVSYYMWLLMIPLMSFFKNTQFNRQYFLILFVFIVYTCIRAYSLDFYQTIFIPDPIYFGLR